MMTIGTPQLTAATANLHTVSRRSMVRLGVAAVGVALLSACGPGGAPGPGGGAASTPAPISPATPAPASTPIATAVSAPTVPPASGQPRIGGMLRVAATADVASLDGHARSAPDTTRSGQSMTG